MKKDWLRTEIKHQRKQQRINRVQRLAAQWNHQNTGLRVVFTQPEVLSLGEWGEVIRITLNKPPEDVQGFCKWLQHTVNKQLGET